MYLALGARKKMRQHKEKSQEDRFQSAEQTAPSKRSSRGWKENGDMPRAASPLEDSQEDSYGDDDLKREDVRIHVEVTRRGSKKSMGDNIFTAPKEVPPATATSSSTSSWNLVKEKKNQPGSRSEFSAPEPLGGSTSAPTGGGWSRAKPKAAPPGPPPPGMSIMFSRLPSTPVSAQPGERLIEPGVARTTTSLGAQPASAKNTHNKKPYSLSDESDLDDLDNDGDETADDEEQSGTGHQEDDGEEHGDDVIRRPIVRNDMSPFEEYVAEKKASGITLTRKSGRYDEKNEGWGNEEDEDRDDRAGEGGAAGGALGADSYRADRNKSRTARDTPHKSYGGLLLGSLPFVMVAHDRGIHRDHVQCTIYRDRSTITTKLYPEYQLVLDDTKKPLMLARKMSMNMTSNYHVFDLTRGVAGSKLTKKSGNYLGKIRALNSARTEYVIVGKSAEREEYGGIIFERLTMMDQLKAGSQPRKMVALVPALDGNSIPQPNRPSKGDESIAAMLEAPQLGNSKGMNVLETKMPSYENGNYRLNFRGRVNLPSVKNFQLVSPSDTSDVICQFGKVNEEKFHLDFKAPLNAFQAFSLAITQFNL